jgi:hypothetical protein
MEEGIAGFSFERLSRRPQTVGHGFIDLDDAEAVVQDGNQIRNGVKGPFPQLFGIKDLPLVFSRFKEAVPGATGVFVF